ncbi:hypothetical protein ACWOC1_13345 [Enterococcus quebecensis]|uniref:Uncharacterized protein n=1 Tax=Enterococcus quebecensis TaxID=903983 RepID=A0A1E5GPR5_9ENTE|nr:hypothetical protein [Enterococcus quebecensis]OEG14694.1 hypothetical protein BCR23_12760 [Enterococcus quebecensis]OJG73251.1 hypothetical protein RV12_GL000658 [Enterococcus quebecensis]
MLASISDLLNVERTEFELTGAFNAILGADSELFVDPALIFNTDILEFTNAKEKITDYFSGVLKLIRRSNQRDDKFWRTAIQMVTIPEVKGLSIGYSSESSDGNGIGKTLAKKIIEDANLIINESENDIYFFELLGLFEKGLGADRISDMIIHIMLDDFQNYSKRICDELGVNYEEKCLTSEGNHIIIIPQSLLTNLPHSTRVFKSEVTDESVRETLNVAIGKSWRDAFTKENSSEVDKHAVLESFASNPEIFEAFILDYLNTKTHTYNFSTDPDGEFLWYHETQETVKNSLDKYKKEADLIDKNDTNLKDKVIIMCDIFKDLVENNGLDSLFYKDSISNVRNSKNEKAIQLVFYGVSHFFCKQNNIDLTPESNTGRGPVDFKCSLGNEKILIEVKKTIHSRLEHGYFTQLEEYKKSEKTKEAIFLLVIVDGKKSIDNLNKFKEKVSNAEKGKYSKIIYINAQKKASASKM